MLQNWFNNCLYDNSLHVLNFVYRTHHKFPLKVVTQNRINSVGNFLPCTHKSKNLRVQTSQKHLHVKDVEFNKDSIYL